MEVGLAVVAENFSFSFFLGYQSMIGHFSWCQEEFENDTFDFMGPWVGMAEVLA